jgi:DNA-directed RNA polymerase specialized sigma24 family protein
MDTAVWVSIIFSLTVVYAFTLNAMRILHKRAREKNNNAEAHAQIDRLDTAADTALNELSETGRIILDELNEKYQAMLFLYALLDEKKKEYVLLTEGKTIKTPSQPPSRPKSPAAAPRKAPTKKQERIFALHAEGLAPDQIAKRLNLGQGEVCLTIDLAKRKEAVSI